VSSLSFSCFGASVSCGVVDAANCRRVLHEAEAECKLVAILSQEKSVTVQQSAALALAVIAEHAASRDAVRKCGKCLCKCYTAHSHTHTRAHTLHLLPISS